MNGARDLTSLSTEDLIARRTTLQTELDATDNEINRPAGSVAGTGERLKEEGTEMSAPSMAQVFTPEKN